MPNTVERSSTGRESACVYFGVNKLAEVRRRALANGFSFSGFITTACDISASLDARLKLKLENIATAQRKTVAEVLADIIDAA